MIKTNKENVELVGRPTMLLTELSVTCSALHKTLSAGVGKEKSEKIIRRAVDLGLKDKAEIDKEVETFFPELLKILLERMV